MEQIMRRPPADPLYLDIRRKRPSDDEVRSMIPSPTMLACQRPYTGTRIHGRVYVRPVDRLPRPPDPVRRLRFDTGLPLPLALPLRYRMFNDDIQDSSTPGMSREGHQIVF